MGLRTRQLLGLGMLRKLLAVDGTGSGLDADLLDGQQGSHYLSRTNHTGTQAATTITGAYRVEQAAGPTTLTGDGTNYKYALDYEIPAGRTSGRYRITIWFARGSTITTNPTMGIFVGNQSDGSTFSGTTTTTRVGCLEIDIALGSNTQSLVYVGTNIGNVRGNVAGTQSSSAAVSVKVGLLLANGDQEEARSTVEYLP